MSEKQPWTPAEEDTLREACEAGLTAPEIHRRHFPHRSLVSVRNKIQSLGLRTRHPLHYRDDSPSVQEWHAKRQAAQSEAQHYAEKLDWLRPVEVGAPPVQEVTSSPSEITAVAGDMHFGMHDERACALFLRTVEETRAKRVLLNGDTVDLLAVSRYPKDKRSGKTWELRDEVTAFHGFLKELHRIGDSWGIQIIETSANHSGNGTEGRWWRYLNDRIPELLGHGEAEERLSYESWFFPKWSSIKLVDSVILADDLLVLHGDLVRSEAGYTARAARDKWMHSVIVNHTHRMGFAPKTIAAVAGRPPSYVRAYENGCLCKLEVPYGVALNWQQGFSLVSEGGDAFGVEQVLIDNGRANVAALGRTLRA